MSQTDIDPLVEGRDTLSEVGFGFLPPPVSARPVPLPPPTALRDASGPQVPTLPTLPAAATPRTARPPSPMAPTPATPLVAPTAAPAVQLAPVKRAGGSSMALRVIFMVLVLSAAAVGAAS